MRSREEAKVSMYKLVDLLLETNASIVDQHPALKELRGTYKSSLKELLADVEGTTARTDGAATGKRSNKEKLAQAAFDVANIVKVYAVQTDDAVLRSDVDYSLTELKRLKDELLPGMCRRILERAQKPKSILIDKYLLTEDMLVTLEALINQYSESTTAPRQAVTKKSVSNKNAAARQKALDKLLKEQMDPMVQALASREPDFVTNYLADRTIVDAPGKRGNGGTDATK